jgi:hypothetical protein
MGRGRKYGGEPGMTLSGFKALVGTCSSEEIRRLRQRYRTYERWHRQVFLRLLQGEFADDAQFKHALLEARRQAAAAGRTSNAPCDSGARTSAGGLGRTNERKFIKLATRILFLRMTSGAVRTRDGRIYAPWPLPCDEPLRLEPAAAKWQLVAKLKPWGVGYDAIRKYHVPFQDQP